MKIKIEISFSGELVLPQHYNNIIQAVIYKWINDDNYRDFIHNEGYRYEKRNYKLFSFSKLFGKFSINRERGTITFYDKLYLYLSAMDERFLQYLANGIISSEKIILKGKEAFVTSIEVIREEPKEELLVYTLSPITVSSTAMIGENKKTYYYTPMEKEFSEMIRKNLTKKIIAFTGSEPDNLDFEIKKAGDKLKESVLSYKGFVIKGWNGEFLLKGSKEIMSAALNSGLGSKNSQGFGFIMIKK